MGGATNPNTCDDGIHDWEELIDPRTGGWMRCRKCGKSVDCEDPDGEDLG
jgi:hypothetical protein